VNSLGIPAGSDERADPSSRIFMRDSGETEIAVRVVGSEDKNAVERPQF
jgi:hypothetical protein